MMATKLGVFFLIPSSVNPNRLTAEKIKLQEKNTKNKGNKTVVNIILILKEKEYTMIENKWVNPGDFQQYRGTARTVGTAGDYGG